MAMKDIPGLQFEGHNLRDYMIDQGYFKRGRSWPSFLLSFDKLRIKYDFEYWAITRVTIQDKISKKPMKFSLRHPQRKLFARMEKQRLRRIPIRIKLLKARQWGGSTLIQLYMAWISVVLRENWHSAICADVEPQARNIRGMFSRFAKHYPKISGTITLKPYEGSAKVRVVAERGNIIGVGSMPSPDALRSFDFAMLHLSEIGLWKKTENRTPEDLVQALRATVPSEADTLIALESTAKGVGNFWHHEWMSGINNESGYECVFISFFEIEMYQRKIKDYTKFINEMKEADWILWEKGACLEAIHWYKTFKYREGYSDWMMQSEFPCDWQEAFQSTGRRAFAPMYVIHTKKNCHQPLMKGELFADAEKGEGAFKNIRFEKVHNGSLWVWQPPDHSLRVANRYGLFGDIGGRTLKADRSAIRVIDRYWMIEGESPEMVATWHGILDQDLFAWKGAQLAYWYCKGLYAIETNSLRTNKDDNFEGDHFLTILDEIVNFYDNLYLRTTPDSIRQGAPAKYGFHTNRATKPMIIDQLNAAMRDSLYIERDQRACDECDSYEIKSDGSYGAVEGSHDDLVVSTAGVVWMALKYMDAPYIVKEMMKRIQTGPTSAAIF
jgi:hypothetical protein